MKIHKLIAFFLACFFITVSVFAQQENAVHFPEEGLPEDRSAWGKQKKAKELYHLGYQQYVRQRYKDALELLDEAIILKSDFVEAYIIRGNTKERLNDLQGALVDYEIVLHLNPEYTEARFNRALTLYKHERFEQALEDFKYLLENPASETQGVYFKGVNHGEEQATAFSGVMTMNSAIHADLYNYMALCYQGMDNFAQAVFSFNQAIAEKPDDPALYLNRALVHEAVGNVSKAMEDYEKTLKLDPSNAAAANNLTSLAVTTGDNTRAGQAFDQAIEEDPWAYTAYLNRGLLKQQQGQHKEAIQDFDKALELSPQQAAIWAQRAFSREKIEDLSGALSDYTHALKYDAYSAPTFLNRGNVYFKMEAYEQAVADYNRALRLDARNPKTYYNRGLALHRMGKKESACQDLQQALELGFKSAEQVLQAYCQ